METLVRILVRSLSIGGYPNRSTPNNVEETIARSIVNEELIMKATWRSLAFAGLPVLAFVASCCPSARAQVVSYGYLGPGGLVGVGNAGYWNGFGYVRSGYPTVAPRTFVAAPVAPVYVRPSVIVGRPLVVRRHYVEVRPYARYYSHHGYYRRVW
jgi:hypothetical protein